MIDDNVHMQNSIQLISKLQDQKVILSLWCIAEAVMAGVEIMAAFSNLKTKFIYRHLLEKPAPKGLSNKAMT